MIDCLFSRRISVSLVVSGLALSVASLLAGCGSSSFIVLGTGGGGSSTPYNGLAFTASVMAGSQAVAGASVQLYAAGSTGNGSAAKALGNGLTSDATGSVSFPAGYVCPSAGSQLYVVSKGGSVGAASSANANLVMMSAVGGCSAVVTGEKIVVNEATTVAGAVALAPFYAASGMVGGSSTNTTGISNAFATAAELVNPATGSAPGLTMPTNATAPTARVDALANLVNVCAVSAASCGGVFAAATVGTAPSNTLDAVYNIVSHPANNVASVYASSQGSMVYAPTLKAAPADWTFFLTLSGGGMNGPSGIGVDSTGSVWVASYFGAATKFTPLGGLTFANGVTGGGLNNSYGLAMDLKDNAWIPNEQPASATATGSVSEFSPAGTSLAGTTGYTAGGMNYPISVAIDPDTTAWVVDYGDSHLTLLNSSGVPTAASGANGFSSTNFSFPVAVVVDANHAGWVANQAGTMVTKASNDGKTFTNYNCCNGASGIAIDQGNNVWVANYYGASVSLISNTGTIVSNGTYTGAGGIDHPQGIAVDGAGNIWVANYRAPYLTVLAGTVGGKPGTALTPATGYGADAQLLEAYALAVDASGSVWVSNFGSDTVTRFVGLATPVKTPLSGAAKVP